MLAYSSIAHAGYLLGGMAAMGWSRNTYPAMGMLVYLAAYTFMNLGAFAVLTYLKGQSPGKFDYSLKQFAGLGRRSPWAAVLLSLFLLSLTGIPGTAGFIGKFYVFGGMVQAGLVWLAVVGVVLSAVSAYYYLRVIIYMFFKEPEEELSLRAPISGGMAAALASDRGGHHPHRHHPVAVVGRRGQRVRRADRLSEGRRPVGPLPARGRRTRTWR